jgi:hypothetical protein
LDIVNGIIVFRYYLDVGEVILEDAVEKGDDIFLVVNVSALLLDFALLNI